MEIDQKRNRLDGIIMQKIERERERLEASYSLLKAHNPLNILDKGYALVFDEEHRLIRDSNVLMKQNRISVRLKNGEIGMEVRSSAKESKGV